MEIYENLELFHDQLKDLSDNYKTLYCNLKQLRGEHVDNSLIQKSEKYLKNEDSRLERLKKIYACFSSQISQLCENYMSDVNNIEEEDHKEVTDLNNDFEKMKNELKKKNEELKDITVEKEKEFSFVYRGSLKSKMDVELVKNYPGSYIYKEYMSDRRNADGNLFIDRDGKNDEWIAKYMKNDMSLIEDIEKMDFEKKEQLFDDLSFLELPIKREIIKHIGCNEDNKIMEAWRERRVVMVNGKNVTNFNVLLMRKNLFNSTFDNELLKNIQYYEENNTFYIDLQLMYFDVIENYLKKGRLDTELVKKYNNHGDSNELMHELKMIGIELNKEEKNIIEYCFFQPSELLPHTQIVNQQYDSYLKEWAGDYEWKLLYRASEHHYTGKSFHDCCDDKGPTLVIIKSSEGWIFGGYTTQSWSGRRISSFS